MGNISQRESNSIRRQNSRRDSEKPNRHHGLVQGGSNEGMEKHFSPNGGECSTRISSDGGRSLDHHTKSILALPHGQVEILASSKHFVCAAREAIMDAPLRKISECFGKDPSGTSDLTKESSNKRPIEIVVMGNLSLIKLLQFSMPTIACTLDILSNQAQFRILKHSMNLFPSVLRERNELRQAWKLKEIGEEPSSMCFDSRISPNPIMNILIWNCRGAMKPTFKKTVMDLVEWHQPVICDYRDHN